MPATLHALGLILLAGITVAASASLVRRPPSPARTLLAMGAGVLLLVVSLALGSHGCARGSPRSPGIAGALALAGVVLAVRAPRPLAAAAGVVVVATIGLTFHFSGLAHHDAYTGESAHDLWLGRQRDEERNRVAQALAARTGSSPPGWLRDLPATPEVPAMTRAEVAPLWHSAFTGLYSLAETRVELWFPGGTWAAGAAALEWRDRPR